MYIAIDIGGTKTEIGFFESEDLNSLVHTEKFETLQSFEEEFEKIVTLLRDRGDNFQAINISFPGAVNNDEIKRSVNLPDYRGESLDKRLEKELGTKVNLIHDSVCSALAEFMYGDIKKYKRMVHLILGTGLGGAIVENGDKLKITPIEPGGQIVEAIDGRKHEFNKAIGLLEAYVGGGNLETHLKTELEKIADDHEIWKEVADYLAVGINNINCLVRPEVVILGGGFGVRRSFLVEKVNEKLKQYNDFLEPVKVELTKVEGNSSLIGALAVNFVENLVISN